MNKGKIHNLDHFGKDNEFVHCLLPLLDSLGWRGDQFSLFEALPHFSDDLDLTDMLNCMANLQYQARADRATQNGMDPRCLPCLFIPDRGPARVIIKINDQGTLTYNGQTKAYEVITPGYQSGTAYFFTSLKKQGVNLFSAQPKWFQQVLMRFMGTLLMGLFFTGVLSLLALVTPVFVMAIYDQVLSSESSTTLGYFIIGILIFVFGDFGFHLLRSKIFSFISVRLGNITSNQVLRRILYLPMQYTESASLGGQMAQIKDFDTVKDFFSSQALISLFELPFVVLLLFAMVVIAGPLAYVPVAAILIFIAFGVIIVPLMKSHNTAAARSGSEKSELLVEILANLRAIKYTGTVDLWLKRFAEVSSEASLDSYQSAKTVSFVNSVSTGVVNLAALITMGSGVVMVLNGQLSLGGLMASMLLVWRILAPVKTSFGVMAQMGRIYRSVGQINRLMELKLERRSESVGNFSHQFKGNVEFSQVSIRYSFDAHPALLNINFSISPGETLVIVGHNGSGKSTILKLIQGLYKPQAGRVFVDGINAQEMDPVELRRGVAYVPQQGYLFHGTVSQNLRLAKPDATDAELEAVAKTACIFDMIQELPRGFNSKVGTKDISQLPPTLVYGIGLARGLLTTSKLMLVDMPEQGITLKEQEKMIKSLQTLKGDRTLLIATARASFLELADKVLWLDRGRDRMFNTADKVITAYKASNG